MSAKTSRVPTDASRREFLKSTSAAAGAVLASGLVVPRGVHAQGADSDTLKIGLVGCGGRGSGAAAQALSADSNCKLIAMGDAFEDRISQCRRQLGRQFGEDKLDLPDDRCFAGFDAFKFVVESGVDVVLLATPPHFRPEHYRYAVEAGKHLFIEKPVAVDAPGVRSVMETNKLAKEKGLAVVSGLCWRYDLGVRETMRQLKEEKLIGEITSIQSDYLAGQLWHRGDKPEWSRMEYQMRNWLYFTWLSGDHNVEQHVHSLDKVMWLMDDRPPLRASGMGGRIQRTEPKFGNIYDHFAVTYEFEGGLHAHCRCRQQDDTDTHVDEYVTGTQGHAEILEHEIIRRDGKAWKYDGPKPNMYDVEHAELFASIRRGEPIHNGDYMAKSTMLAIMGRMVAYTGQSLTWDECLASTERLGPTVYEWSDNVPESVVAVPGRTKFV
jgi:predicted dehydrogenase